MYMFDFFFIILEQKLLFWYTIFLNFKVIESCAFFHAVKKRVGGQMHIIVLRFFLSAIVFLRMFKVLESCGLILIIFYEGKG